MLTRTALLVTSLLLAVAVAPAQGASRHPDLWATVNICDTPDFPNTMGVRGSMPALERRSRLWMRFRAQYFDRADQKWHNFRSSERTDSGWQDMGRARRGRVREYGWRFHFLPPEGDQPYRLRGRVHFKWTRRGRAVARERRKTSAGHRSTKGADPKGYSAAVCLLS